MILPPSIVETFEAVWGESNRSCGREVEAARVEEIQESVLQDLRGISNTFSSLNSSTKITSVQTFRCSNFDSASPPITAFAILPIPDCRGSKFFGKRS